MSGTNRINDMCLAILGKAEPDALSEYELCFLQDLTSPEVVAITQRQYDFMQSIAQKVGCLVDPELPIARRQVNGANILLGTLGKITPRTPSRYQTC